MPYRLTDKQVLYDGSRVRLEIHHLENEQGHRIQKEVCAHPGAVLILPVLPDGSVLLIRNRRQAIGQTLIELPAGTLEKGEDPINCAGRELVEETGYMAGRLEPLASFYTSPGILGEKMHAFVAYDLEPSETALDDGEEIEVMPTPFASALEMIRDGRIADGKSIAMLLFYDRFREHRRMP
jgi:ADP-ribose pyrophosphatase